MLRVRALFVAVIAAGAAAVTGTSPAVAAEPGAKVDMVALGDSYAAGVGAGAETGGCRETEGAYAALWAAADSAKVSLTRAACSGATTDDVVATQLKSLTEDTDLVTLTVGGNDLALVAALQVCADQQQATACAKALDKIKEDLAKVLPGKVGAVLHEVTTRAPKAKVVVLGYPSPFAAVADCQAVPLPTEIREAGIAALAGVDAVLTAQAAAAGAIYADVAKVFSGHELCGTSPWLVGVEGIGDNTILHPTLEGQRAGYLAALTAAAGTPSDVVAWIAQRDAAASPSATATPTATATTPAPVAAAGGRAGGGLPVTGPDLWWLIAIGAVLLIGGGLAFYGVRPSSARVDAG